jgi:hypothetical protein
MQRKVPGISHLKRTGGSRNRVLRGIFQSKRERDRGIEKIS